MAIATRRRKASDGLKVKGAYHLQIVDPDGRIVGDSGWRSNVIVNLGFDQYLARALGAITGSKQVSHMAIGSGTAPGAADTALSSEVTGTNPRSTVAAASSANSKGVRFTATFWSSQSFIGATVTLSNLGLVNSSSVGTLFCGNTFASSQCQTNQNVNGTYDVTFS